MSAEFDERVMTVPLRDARGKPIQQRADYAMKVIRAHLAQHFNVEESEVRLDSSINEAVWERGRSKPPSKLRVRAPRFEEAGEAVVEAETA